MPGNDSEKNNFKVFV